MSFDKHDDYYNEDDELLVNGESSDQYEDENFGRSPGLRR